MLPAKNIAIVVSMKTNTMDFAAEYVALRENLDDCRRGGEVVEPSPL